MTALSAHKIPMENEGETNKELRQRHPTPTSRFHLPKWENDSLNIERGSVGEKKWERESEGVKKISGEREAK